MTEQFLKSWSVDKNDPYGLCMNIEKFDNSKNKHNFLLEKLNDLKNQVKKNMERIMKEYDQSRIIL